MIAEKQAEIDAWAVYSKAMDDFNATPFGDEFQAKADAAMEARRQWTKAADAYDRARREHYRRN